ncbi:nicotinic acid mononucleotide adenyltransferase [Bizionia gelidisalsuginis]|uniref:Nicotinic acid mononucleotide adenyltransferase n=2 Tax=Bizionia TaxID=283785 RepID=A0A8H2LF33_9FLAO|nr:MULTISPECIES: nicotinic acid mononucleotide adenyltransferase [Bizionia]TYB76097.1 nicotinic acid mononucleotide adenyltransferase [Bizionia saleffrena]TYC11389.1 nicotinic acid mononucleotide adenyltransferase [Bizionia gelidisalsuginis]
MKKILVFALLLSVTFTSAQNETIHPKFEKQGDIILATYYHNNGEIAQKGYFNKANKLEGTWVSFNNKGTKQSIGQYTNGVKVGKWLFWKENSLREVDYNNNVIANVGEWKNKTHLAIAD